MKNITQFLKRFVGGPSETRAVTPAALLMPLEPRIVYDASVAAVGAASHHHFSGVERAAGRVGISESAAELFRNSAVSGAVAGSHEGEAPGASRHSAQGTQRAAERSDAAEKQVVFVDPNVTDYQSLLTGLPPGAQYVVLNPKTDGLEQIAQYLRSHPGVDAIHLISHGSDAQIQVGSTLLDTSDLGQYSAELAQIGAMMKPGGDFLIYDCDVAADADGKALVQQIAALTNLNVAASTDATGAASLGGNWTLEYDVGAVHTQVIFSATAEQQYDHLLGQTTETYTSGAALNLSTGDVPSFSLDGITYTYNVANDSVTQVDPSLQGLSDEHASDNSLAVNADGVLGLTSMTISMTDGHAFKMSSFDIDVVADTDVAIKANGSATNEIVLHSNGTFVTQTVDLTANSAFNSVTSITITFANPIINLGHLVYTEITPPVVTTRGGITPHESGTTATVIDSGIALTDAEAATQTSATVSIGTGFHSGDTLAFMNSNSTLYGDIRVSSYNSATGVLTLASSGGSTNAQWANALDAITFTSTSTTYGNRTISLSTNDGLASSTPATDTVDLTAPPTITTDAGSAPFVAGDNGPSTPVAVDGGLTVTDASSLTLVSATASITNNFHSGEDVLVFTNTSSTTFGNIAGSYNATTGVLTLTSSSDSASIAQWQAALDAVRYTDTAVTPNNATRTISFSVTDFNNVTSITATRNVTVADTDQTPIVTTTGGTTLNYIGGASAMSIDSGITVSDLDNTTQSSGTASIGTGFHSGDTLSFTNGSATLYGNISVSSYNAGTGVLTLTSSGATATDAQWANALSAVTFSSTSASYGNRTISFVTNDGTSNSAAATDTVDMTNPLSVTTDSGSAAFVAGDNTASAPVTIDSGLTLTDAGTSMLQSATVSITNNFHSGEDVLAFGNTSSTTFGNIAGSYSAGVLTLTSAGNSATLAQWQAALDAVTYTDSTVTPNNQTRTISFSVTDGNSIVSNTATRNVTVADTDQTPIVTTTGGTNNYVGGTTPRVIDPGVTVSDRDNTTQASATVSIGSGFHGGDVLFFTNTSATLYGNVTGSYNAATGVLTLTSSGAIATDAQWSNALSAVAFSAAGSATPGNRTLSFVTNDGTKNSVAATDTVDVLGPPSVTTDSGSAAFVAGDNAASTPVTVDSGLTLTDASTSAMQSATASITSNFHSGEDVLAFANTNSTTFGNIAGSYNATSGVLTLTSSGNSATLAQWQAALDAVTYTDTAITPNNATRAISFSVTDANSNASNTATRNVTVADTDQTPIVTTTGGTTSYVGGTTPGVIDPGVTVSDRDNTTQASATVSIGSGFHSGDVLSFTNTSATLYGNVTGSYNAATGVLTLTSSGAIATDAQWSNALSAVAFSAAASATPGNRTLSFVTNDGTKNSVAATDTVDVLGPPSVTTDSGSAAFVAGDNTASSPVTVDSGLTLTDASTSAMQSATASITSNFHSGEDVLAFANTNSATFGNIAASYNATSGVLTLTSAGNSATLAQWQAALDAVTYTDTAITPNNATRTISFSVTDANSNVSNTATRNVTVADTDQTPIVTTTGGTTNYVGGTTPGVIDPGVTVSDQDNTTQASATVSIGNGFHGGDVLSFTNTSATLYGNVTGSYNAATGVLTLTSSGAIATDAQWSNALSAVAFSAAASATPGNRTLSFVTNDGTKNSVAATDTVDVLGPPSVTTDSGSAAFVAGDNIASTPVTIDSGLTLTDAGASTLQSATVSITNNFHSGEDVLAFDNTGSTTFGNIAASYNATSGVLTLTSAGNSATLAQWQAALDAVTYTDTAVTPNNATRTISFSVTDANSNASNTATRNVTVADTDQTPIVTTTGGTSNYVGGTTPGVIDPGVTVSDRDNTTQASATVSIGSGFHSGDVLLFTNTSATLYGNVTGSYNAATGVLTLTSSGAIATDAQWSNALSAVAFSAAASATPGNRTLSFVTNDGTKNSVAATDTVDVLGPPSVTTDSGSAAFVAGDNTASSPVTVDSGLTLTDASTSAMQSATASITSNFRSGEDVLAFANTNSTTFGNIAASYNATSGVLTLTSAGNSATLAQWQAALDAVTYTDTAITPNNATRTISFSVTDANSNVSNTATRNVTVADTDQTPIVTTTGGTTNYVGGTTPGVIDPGVTVSDRDNTTQASATVSVGSGFRSGDVLLFANTSATLYGNVTGSYNAATGVLTLTSSGAIATDAQWSNALSAVAFSAAASATPGNRTLSFVTNDGTKNSVAATDTVDVLGPPSVTTDSGSAAFVAGDNVNSTPIAVDSGITLGDASSGTLASATVAITSNFHAGEDVLSFTNNGSTMGDVAASYNATTGVLTLTSSGGATLTQWQAALDAVTYTDTAITPNSQTRTVSFSVIDGSGNVSNTATRTVTVADADQTPIVTTTGGTINYVGGAVATVVDSGVTVSDLDNATQTSGTVSISTGFHSGDTLSFTNTGATLFGNITSSYNATTGVMTLTSAGSSATDAQWENALEAVKLSAGSGTTPGNRTVSFVTNDGTENSVAATKIVDVIGPPSITTDVGSAAFVAGDNVTSMPVAVDSGISISDAGSPTLASANVSITGNFHSGEDVLSFTNPGSTMGNIVGTYDATTGVLALTSSGASATLAQWQAALGAVTYTDTAITPNNAARTISFIVTDGNSNISDAATRAVTVSNTDQTPVVTTTGGTTNYVGGAAAIVVDGGVAVSDRDSATQSSATVSIDSGFNAGDTLAFSNSSSATYGNISASYNATTGVLMLTSSSATATNAQWQSALDSVTFSAGSAAVPGNRTVAFTVNDGTKSSAFVTQTVDLIGPPSVIADSGSAPFVAADNTGSTPIVVDPGIAIADAGSSVLASATVAVTGNFHSGEDVLSFANDGSTMGNVSGSYNATTGVLTLTSSGATATLAQWQASLRSVTYTDMAVTPNNATRTVSFSVIDGNGNGGNTVARTVTVTDTDQTPIVTTTTGSTGYVAGAPATAVDSGLSVSDRDNTSQSSAVVSIGSGFQSGDMLSFSNASASTYGNIAASYDAATGTLTLTSAGATATDAQWASALDGVKFSTGPAALPGNRTISFVINDGADNSAAATRSVAVIAPPSIVTDSGSASFVAADNVASTPIVVDPGIALSDAGNSMLASATVTVTGGFHSGEDALSFANDRSTMGNISGSYNATTGVLTLTSSGATATLAQWQAALQSVTYTDTAVTPNNAVRTFSFSVIDGNGNGSNAATRTVAVQDTDQTPIVVTTGGNTRYEAGPPATTVDGGITVSDRDNATLASATVSIGAGFHSGDELSLASGGAATNGNITAAYNASTGVLTLTSSGATATISQWQAALETIQFSSPATALAGSRTISFAVNDGTDVSVVATKTLDVVSIPFIPATMPHPAVGLTTVGDEPVATTNENVPLIILTALDPQPSVSTVPGVRTVTFSSSSSMDGSANGARTGGASLGGGVYGAHVGNAFQFPAPLFSSRPWLSSPIDLQRPIDVYSPIEHLDVPSQQPFSLSLASPTRGGDGEDATSVTLLEQTDGSPLPAWMRYDAATGVLSGTAPAGNPREIHIFVTVRHGSGAATRREVVIDFRAPGAPDSHGIRMHSHAPHAALRSTKPSLTEQFARQRSEFHVSHRPSIARPKQVA